MISDLLPILFLSVLWRQKLFSTFLLFIHIALNDRFRGLCSASTKYLLNETKAKHNEAWQCWMKNHIIQQKFHFWLIAGVAVCGCLFGLCPHYLNWWNPCYIWLLVDNMTSSYYLKEVHSFPIVHYVLTGNHASKYTKMPLPTVSLYNMTSQTTICVSNNIRLKKDWLHCSVAL